MAYTVTAMRIDEHRTALAELWHENFDEDEIIDYLRERFDWLYANTPDTFARTWLAVHSEAGTVVGCGSAYRANRVLRGNTLQGCVPVVFAVSNGHRIGGAALAIQRAIANDSCRAGLEVLLGRPNTGAKPILTRIGYQSLGESVRWVQDIDRSAVSDWDARFPIYRDEIVEVADARFDDLWSTGREHYDEIITERTAAFLNQRYAGFKELSYRIYCLVRRSDERLVGYVVFRPWRQGLMVADVFCESPTTPILEALLVGFESRMRDEGADWIAIAYLGASWFTARLEALGYGPSRKHRDEIMVYTNPGLDANTRQTLADPARWCLFGGDSHIFM